MIKNTRADFRDGGDCIYNCATDSLPQGPCSSIEDLDCTCSNARFHSAVAACIWNKCPDMESAMLMLQREQCQEYLVPGNTTLPFRVNNSTGSPNIVLPNDQTKKSDNFPSILGFSIGISVAMAGLICLIIYLYRNRRKPTKVGGNGDEGDSINHERGSYPVDLEDEMGTRWEIRPHAWRDPNVPVESGSSSQSRISRVFQANLASHPANCTRKCCVDPSGRRLRPMILRPASGLITIPAPPPPPYIRISPPASSTGSVVTGGSCQTCHSCHRPITGSTPASDPILDSTPLASRSPKSAAHVSRSPPAQYTSLPTANESNPSISSPQPIQHASIRRSRQFYSRSRPHSRSGTPPSHSHSSTMSESSTRSLSLSPSLVKKALLRESLYQKGQDEPSGFEEAKRFSSAAHSHSRSRSASSTDHLLSNDDTDRSPRSSVDAPHSSPASTPRSAPLFIQASTSRDRLIPYLHDPHDLHDLNDLHDIRDTQGTPDMQDIPDIPDSPEESTLRVGPSRSRSRTSNARISQRQSLIGSSGPSAPRISLFLADRFSWFSFGDKQGRDNSL